MLLPNTNQPTRRDYVFVNQEALQLIQDFEVVHQTDYPVRSIPRISFVAAKSRSTYFKVAKLASMTAFIDDCYVTAAISFIICSRACIYCEAFIF